MSKRNWTGPTCIKNRTKRDPSLRCPLAASTALSHRKQQGGKAGSKTRDLNLGLRSLFFSPDFLFVASEPILDSCLPVNSSHKNPHPGPGPFSPVFSADKCRSVPNRTLESQCAHPREQKGSSTLCPGICKPRSFHNSFTDPVWLLPLCSRSHQLLVPFRTRQYWGNRKQGRQRQEVRQVKHVIGPRWVCDLITSGAAGGEGNFCVGNETVSMLASQSCEFSWCLHLIQSSHLQKSNRLISYNSKEVQIRVAEAAAEVCKAAQLCVFILGTYNGEWSKQRKSHCQKTSRKCRVLKGAGSQSVMNVCQDTLVGSKAFYRVAEAAAEVCEAAQLCMFILVHLGVCLGLGML